MKRYPSKNGDRHGTTLALFLPDMRAEDKLPGCEVKKRAVLTCPFCKLALTLHGQMLEEVKREIKKLEEKAK